MLSFGTGDTVFVGIVFESSGRDTLLSLLTYRNFLWRDDGVRVAFFECRIVGSMCVARVAGYDLHGTFALGLDTVEHCADYIQLYNGDVEVLTKSMDYIQKTAASILDGLQAQLAGADAGPEEVAA